MLTSEMLSPVLDGMKANIAIIVPIAIGLFVLGMGVGFVVEIIKLFLWSRTSVSPTVFEDYFEPYIIEEGSIDESDFLDLDFDIDSLAPDDWWLGSDTDFDVDIDIDSFSPDDWFDN